MTLRDEVRGILSGWSPFGEGSRLLEMTAPDGRLRCELTALDAIACSFDRFTWDCPALAGADFERLMRAADDLSRRLTYLLEPIALVEADPTVGVAQLRSDPPQRSDGGVTYYELLVGRAGELQLCRFHRVPGEPRRPVAAQVTREVLARLAEDFAAAAASAARPAAPAPAAQPDLRAILGSGAKRMTIIDLSKQSAADGAA